MPSKLHVEIGRRRGMPLLKLSGVLDEHSQLDALRSRLQPGDMLLDLSGIERLSSIGVRAWIDWMQRAEHGGTRFVLLNCSPAFVVKLSRIHVLAQTGRIYSILAPYHCPSCNSDARVTLKVQDLVGRTPIDSAPEHHCKRCDRQMDFDETPESYFAFMNSKRSLPSEGEAGPQPEDGRSTQKPRKRITTKRSVIAKALPSYLQWQLSPTQLQHVADGTRQLQPDGALRMVTVLMCNIRNFSALSEKIVPLQFVKVLNDYFEQIERVLFQWEGTLDRLVGSELIGLFGAPIPQPDAASRAVQCAIDMQAALQAWNIEHEVAQSMPIEIGIGIHTGPAIVGAIGSVRSRQHTAIGEAVKLASQLCMSAKASEILASDATLDGIADKFECIAIASARPKAAAKPLGVCRVLGRAR